METRVTAGKSPTNGTEGSKSTSDTGFVFGQKLEDRVESAPPQTSEDTNRTEDLKPADAEEKEEKVEPEEEKEEPVEPVGKDDESEG